MAPRLSTFRSTHATLPRDRLIWLTDKQLAGPRRQAGADPRTVVWKNCGQGVSPGLGVPGTLAAGRSDSRQQQAGGDFLGAGRKAQRRGGLG